MLLAEVALLPKELGAQPCSLSSAPTAALIDERYYAQHLASRLTGSYHGTPEHGGLIKRIVWFLERTEEQDVSLGVH